MKKVDQTIVLEAIRGDEEAIKTLIENYYQRILYTTIRKFGVELGTDVAHKAVIEIIQSIKNLKEPDKFEVWMMRLVGYVCTNEIKLKYRDREVFTHFKEGDPTDGFESESQEFLPEEYVINEEKRERVLQLIKSLPEKYQDALMDYYFHNMSYDEIAELRNISNATVTNYLHRAKVMLKKRIEATEGKQFTYSVAIGAMPMLSQLFKADAAAKLTPGVCTSFLGGIQLGLSKAGIASGTSAGSSAASGVALKAVVVSAISIGVAGSILMGTNMNKPKEPVSVPTTIIESTVASTTTEVIPVVIETLEDMIGVEEAKQLIGYETNVTNTTNWMEFLEHIEAEVKSVSSEPDSEYTMYLLRKQDKQLMIAEKKNKSNDQCSIFYQFGDIAELPLIIEIVLMFG